MAIVTLEEMKAELGVTIAEDDALITAKIDEAQAHLEALLGYDIETEFGTGVPADLVAAVKMIAAHWYENREASVVGVSVALLPVGVDDIVRNRRNYSYGAGYAEG